MYENGNPCIIFFQDPSHFQFLKSSVVIIGKKVKHRRPEADEPFCGNNFPSGSRSLQIFKKVAELLLEQK